MAIKNTPGPWQVSTKPNGSMVVESDAFSALAFVDVHPDSSPKTRERRRKDAQLMAAAPDLLDLAKAMVSEDNDLRAAGLRDYGPDSKRARQLNAARAAIIKATGANPP